MATTTYDPLHSFPVYRHRSESGAHDPSPASDTDTGEPASDSPATPHTLRQGVGKYSSQETRGQSLGSSIAKLA